MSIKKGKTRYIPDCDDSRLRPQLLQWIQPVNTGSSNVFCFQCKVCEGVKIFLFSIGVGVIQKTYYKS